MKMQSGFSQIIMMQQANLLQLPDAEFNRFIAEIEQSPLFHRLYQQAKVIRYQRFAGTDISPRFYQHDVAVIADSGSLDIESLLSNRKKVIRWIERIGVEKFKQFFLYAEPGITFAEITSGCGLEKSEVAAINSLVDDFAVMSEFYHPSGFKSQMIHYTKIASIEKDRGDFVIGYFTLGYARGRYIIDYSRFEQVLANDGLSTGEIKTAREMFKKLELINHRKDTINNILHRLIRKQVLYLESGNSMALLPFSQKELAREIGVAPSSVSRTIQAKSLITPWGEEIPLKHFLPTTKQFKKELIRQLLQAEPDLASDEAVRVRLREKLGVAISRRSVTELRRELKLPARGKLGKGKEIR